MNLKKLKIIYFPQKKLIIFSFVFLAVLFFQINQAKAVATCSWLYPESGGLFANKTCAELQLGDKIDPPNADCANVTKPSACDWPTTIENNPCLCCCKTTAPTINDTMPKWTNPLDNLQVKIPGLIFTKSNEIKCEEQNGKKICNFPWIGEYIAGIYKYAIGIVGILAAVVLMIGGVIWIMAGGSATMIGEAKAWIGASLTGLVIALCSYVILYQVNPALVGFKGLDITMVEKIKQLVEARMGGTAEQYKNMPCPIKELSNGEEVEIFATGYYFPDWGNDHRRLCEIHMQCSCPAGIDRDTNHNCNDVYPGRTPAYQPCLLFSKGTPGVDYCNSPKVTYGDIAVPSCIPQGKKLCVNGKTYTAKDAGGDIQGRRIDIWSGTGNPGLNAALAATGIKKMKLGACQ